MKDDLRLKIGWLVFILIAIMIISGCPKWFKPSPKEEVSPPKSSEEKQATPAPPSPKEPAPPSPKPGPAPAEPAPPPQKPDTPPTTKPAPPVKPPVPEETYFTHTVKWSGETLWIIAIWYTGDRDHWREISEAMTRANPNVNIHVIRIGDKIPVPVSLMKNREPMTKEFVESFYPEPKPTEPPKPPPPKEPEPFGPK
jgi:Tfp pilus assembly protein FimV